MSARWLLAGLAWCMCGVGVAAPRQEPAQVVSYPVADLIVPVNMDFTRPAPRDIKPRKNDGPGHVVKTCEAELIDLVCRMCDPASWRCNGGAGTISYIARDMRFVVRQTPDVHEQVGRLLADLRRLQDREVSVTTRLFTISGERVRALETAAERGGVTLLPADGPDGVCLSERECVMLLTLLQADPATSIHQSPRVTLFSAQKAVLSILDQLGPQAGDVNQDGEPVKNRAVGLYQVLQPVIEHQRHTVRLYTRTSFTEVKQRKEGRVFTTRTLENTYRIPAGQTLIAKLGRTVDGQHQYVMSTPRIVEQPEQAVGEAASFKPARGNTFARVYDVGDLVTPLGEQWASANEPKHGPPFTSTPPDALAKLIESTATHWKEHGGAGQIAFYPIGNALVVHHTAAVHEEVENLLAALRRLQDLRVGVECRIVEMPEAVARRINAQRPQSRDLAELPPIPRADGAAGLTIPRADAAEEQDRIGPEGERQPPIWAPRPIGERRLTDGAEAAKDFLPLEAGVGIRALSAEQSNTLRGLLAAESGKVAKTKLGGLGFNGQKLRMDATTPRNLVTDVRVTTVDGRLVAKPTQQVFRVGTVIEATPVLSADRTKVHLELAITLCAPSSADGAGQQKTVTVSSGAEKHEFTVGMTPSFATRQVRSVVLLDAGSSVILSMGGPAERRCYFIATPRVYAD
jgi:hypothetical protein